MRKEETENDSQFGIDVKICDKQKVGHLGFDFELIQKFANKFGVEIEIIDNTPKTEEQELEEDLVQIITMFSCKLQGKRSNKVKK